jgi:tRNA A-37 threonylcarbamoyl transferase component Bud32
VPERFLGLTLGGRYTLSRLLGAGAYAWVYEARDTELEIPVAVKVLRPEHTGNEVVETRFRREATTAARLRHPNIVTIRDVGRSDGITWVVMDLVPGSLSRRLQVRSALPEPELVRLALDVANALGAAHAAGVIHRDIKADNILIGVAGEAIVCDFGLARALTGGADLSATNQVVGTPHYFSPEQARGEPLDGRSDLYALGVTLYRAATGRLPFEGDDWYTVARKHVDEMPPDPRSLAPELSPAFAAVLLRLLEKRPSDRYRDAAELFDALAQLPSAPPTGARMALAAGDTTAVHPVVGRALPWWQRPAMLAASAIAVVAVTLWLSRGTPAAGTVWARVSGAVRPVDTVTVLTDSTAVPRADSATADSAAVISTRRDSVALRPPRVRAASVRVAAPAGAELRINGTLIEGSSWSDPQARPGVIVVQTRLVEGPGIDGCPFSQRTDTVRVAAGERLEYTAALARCAVVTLDFEPTDASIQLTDSLGAVVRPSAATPLVVRAGTWRVEGRTPRCAPYDANHVLTPGANAVKFKLIC